jgi:hypothetical protein
VKGTLGTGRGPSGPRPVPPRRQGLR